MKKPVLAGAALAALAGSVHAQTAPHELKAPGDLRAHHRFRTAAGHNQTQAMVAYLIDVLKAGGVPTSDIATLD